jgi:hypothetical protein
MNLLELAMARGINPKKAAGTHGGEYHSECPACGGKDRFIIQPNRQQKKCIGYYFCRKCGKRGDTIQFLIDFQGLSWQEATRQLDIPNTEKRTIRIPQQTKSITTVELHEPPEQWKSNAAALVEQATQEILKQTKSLEELRLRGLPLDAVKKYRFGYVSQETFQEKENWGLSNQKKIWLPKGILIPCVELNGDIIRLKVRRTDWHKQDEWPKYVAIPGSMSGLNIIGNKKLLVMIVIESELDAYALHHVLGDFAFIVAVGGCTKNLDPLTKRLATNKTILLICHDNDEAGKAMLNKWTNLFPHAKGCPSPIGKDIGEAIEAGVDIRNWLMQLLPPNTIQVPLPQNHTPPIETQMVHTSTDDNYIREVKAPCPPTTESKQDIQTIISAIDRLFGITEIYNIANTEPHKTHVVEDKPVDWTNEEQQLIERFRNRTDRPKPPFNLDRARKVTHEKFYERLEGDISCGPRGPRARTGALQNDLIILEQLSSAYMEVT